MKNITRIFQLKIPFVILCGFVFLDIHHMITNSRFILIQLEPGENKDDGSILTPNDSSVIKEPTISALYLNRMARSRKRLTGVQRIEKGWTRSETDESTGSDGEVSQFDIDFQYYSNCKLPGNKPFYVKKYYLAKGDKLDYNVENLPGRDLEENAIAYIATFEKEKIDSNDSPEYVLWNDHLAVRLCGEGRNLETNFMLTSDQDRVGSSGNYQSARRCGFATILSYFCYLDREVEPSIKGESDIGYDFELESKEASNAFEREKLQQFITLVKKSCKRILKVVTTAKPSVGGRSYIYAGMDAGYQCLMTIGKDKVTHAKTHRMQTLNRLVGEKPPQENGDEVVDPVLDELVEKEGNKWFFCKINS